LHLIIIFYDLMKKANGLAGGGARPPQLFRGAVPSEAH
jgi:hypothetical protein